MDLAQLHDRGSVEQPVDAEQPAEAAQVRALLPPALVKGAPVGREHHLSPRVHRAAPRPPPARLDLVERRDAGPAQQRAELAVGGVQAVHDGAVEHHRKCRRRGDVVQHVAQPVVIVAAVVEPPPLAHEVARLRALQVLLPQKAAHLGTHAK